jgi:serine/threonine protein kinase
MYTTHAQSGSILLPVSTVVIPDPSCCAQVVAYCHDMGVMHRDLKLENFLLTDPSDAGATIKVSRWAGKLACQAAAPACQRQAWFCTCSKCGRCAGIL